MRRFLLAVCLLLATSPCWAAAKENLKQLRERLQALQQEIEASEASKTEAADQLKESERAISGTNRSIYDLSQQQREVKSGLAKLQAQTKTVQGGIAQQQASLGKLLYQQYLGGSTDDVKLLLNGENPNQISRNLYYYGYFARQRAQLINSLRQNLGQLGMISGQEQEKAKELAGLQAEEAAQKTRLEQEKKARELVLAAVSKKIESQRKELSKLKQDEERLTKLVERLNRVLAGKKRVPVVSNEKLPDASMDGSPFQQLRGKLNLPVRGELANRFGSPRPEGGVLWKGLFIHAAEGEPVKAIAAGRVVFADWLRGFGNLLILDHGGGYMSLYGNNESVYKQVGDEVHGGDAIAAVGNSGGNPDSGLYFEIRYQGRPFDPIPWTTLK